jgi:hypothetical protein
MRVGLDLEPIAAGHRRDEAGVAERAPQPADERLQRVHVVGGQLLLPQRVDELPGGDRAPGVECEAGEQRAQAPATHVDPVAVVLDFERTEHADAHQPHGSRPGGWPRCQCGYDA